MIKKMKCFFVLIIFLISYPWSAVYADWQSDLENEFDIVSTFDDLDDWKGSHPANAVDIETYPNEFPVKTIDKSPSIWQYYSLYDSFGDSNWIQDHGPAKVWRGVGKSMSIDYSDGVDHINRGPSRLGFKIGDSPDDGYEEVHVFFMSKWDKDFFKRTGDSFDYHRFLKTLDISAGFKDVRHWGTDEEHKWVLSKGGSTQVLNEYGINAQIYNYYSYGSDPRAEIIINTILTTDKTNKKTYDDEVEMYTDLNVGEHILEDKWFGLEYRVKMSNPHGADNGEFEIWVYDEEGNVASHELSTGIVNFKDGNTQFEHKWNKFVWGGNRFAGAYSPTSDPLCDFGPVDHFYIDDVIVHGSRIGPDYFLLLNGQKPIDSDEDSNPEGDQEGNDIEDDTDSDNSQGSEDLILYLPLDTDSDVASDLSGNGNDASVNGAAWTEEGKLDGGFSFDGVDDYLVVDSNSDLKMDEFTFSIWMNPLVHNNYQSGAIGKLVSSGSFSYGLTWLDGASNDEIYAQINTEKGTTNLRYDIADISEEWNHWTVSYSKENNGHLKMYRDGILVEEQTDVGSAIQYNEGDLLIGMCQATPSKYYSGSIDDIKIWNRALTEDEIMMEFSGE